MYEGYVSHSVIVQYLIMIHVKHMCMLLPLVMLHVRHVQLGLYIGVSLNSKTTYISSFGCSFVCATTMGCAGFKLLLGMIIVLQLLTIIK